MADGPFDMPAAHAQRICLAVVQEGCCLGGVAQQLAEAADLAVANAGTVIDHIDCSGNTKTSVGQQHGAAPLTLTCFHWILACRRSHNPPGAD